MFLVFINLCPQISMGFSQAMWHRHVNKVLSYLCYCDTEVENFMANSFDKKAHSRKR